jgi:hypothetical protein
MTEQLPAEKQTSKVTPLDFAQLVLRHEKAIEAEINHSPDAGDIVEQDGVKLMYVPEYYYSKRVTDGKYTDTPIAYTYQQYYSHSFEDESTNRMIPAPGWDVRFRLHDNEVAERVHGRTFSADELSDVPTSLPNDVALFLKPLDSYEVEDYLESREA